MKELLLDLGACENARVWATDKTWKEVFETCHRGDWLLWLFQKTNPEQLQELTRAKAYCALTVRHLMKDPRSINACEVALKFADGLATRSELNDAASAAYAVTSAAYAYAVTSAAYDSAYAAAYATYAADAADAAYAATYAARTKNRLETADICRKYLPIEIWNIKS